MEKENGWQNSFDDQDEMIEEETQENAEQEDEQTEENDDPLETKLGKR